LTTTDDVFTDAPLAIDELCRSAAKLVESAQGPLKSVRLQAGDLVVELEWPAGEPGLAPVSPAPAAAVTPTPDVPAGHLIAAPLVGTFYRAPTPGAPPFVEVGDEVAAGQQVAIVEAMKLMNPVEADRAGRVVDILAGDGTSVEYGEALIVLAPL